MNKLTHIENVSSKLKKNGGILDRSMLETMKNSLLIINSEAKVNHSWHPYGETFTDLNSPIIMEIEKNSISTP